MPKCKFVDTVAFDGTEYCVCTAMNTSDRLPQYENVSRRVSGGEVTGSQHQIEKDTNWWKRCAGGKGHYGITPSLCGYYKRAVRNGIKPVPKSKASKSSAKPKKAMQASQAYSQVSSASTNRSSRSAGWSNPNYNFIKLVIKGAAIFFLIMMLVIFIMFLFM